MVKIKHVSSLEAITELRVYKSATVAFSWFLFLNFVENIINKRSCISSYMVTRDIFQILKFHTTATSVEFDKIMFCFNNNNNNNNNDNSNGNGNGNSNSNS